MNDIFTRKRSTAIGFPSKPILANPASIFCLATLAWFSLAGIVDAKDRVLLSFDRPDDARRWQIVNDGVMGGRSVGRFRFNQQGYLEFFGSLSLENNGGFASVRAGVPKMNLASGDSIVIRVRGDGRKYNFNLYAQNNLRGYSYRQSFQTKQNEWIEVTFAVDDFVATWRGRTYPNEKLVPSQVAGLGILLGDKQPGSFKLEIDWIKVTTPESD